MLSTPHLLWELRLLLVLFLFIYIFRNWIVDINYEYLCSLIIMQSNCFLKEGTCWIYNLIIYLWKNMTSKQQEKIKSSIIDTNNCLNGIFSSFNSLNSEFHPGSKLIDIFSSHFSFYKANYHNKETRTAYCNKLDNLILNVSLKSNTIIVISDASIKNNIAISIVYIHSFSSFIKKMLYHAIDITSTVTELFAIRCRISQAVYLPHTSHIIVIMNALHMAQIIFDSTIHPFQLQLIAISKDLQAFFDKHFINFIEF